ncbi:hypothetical protein Tco_0386194, partial [Tanacetum coccineum]
VTILNTLDPLGKFDGKVDEGFLVRYSINSKAFRVFNTRTRKVEENLHINFLENKPNVAGSGLEWLFDIDSLTKSMNYEPEKASDHEYILLPLMLHSPLSLSSQSTYNKDADEKEGYANNTNRVSTVNPFVSAAGQCFDNADDQERINSSTQDVNTARPSINTTRENINTGSSNINTASPIPNDPSMQYLEATSIFDDAYDDKEEVVIMLELACVRRSISNRLVLISCQKIGFIGQCKKQTIVANSTTKAEYVVLLIAVWQVYLSDLLAFGLLNL